MIDYGRSLLRVAAISFGLAALYGGALSDLSADPRQRQRQHLVHAVLFLDRHLYDTLGFGDVRPATLAGEIIVSSEVILGYTTLGLLLSVLAQSIARRS